MTFDPNQPFEVVTPPPGGAPQFDPSKPFEAVQSDPLAAARAGAGPGASEQEIREIAARTAARAQPAPERGLGEQGVRGATATLSGPLGIGPDVLDFAARNTLGTTPGAVRDTVSDWVAGRRPNRTDPVPQFQPETKMENFNSAVGRGAVEAGLTSGAGGVLAGTRAAGPLLKGAGELLAAQPVLQAGTGAVSAGVGEATGSPWAGFATGLGIPAGLAMARKLTTEGFSRLPQAGQDLMDRIKQNYPDLYAQIPASEKLNSTPLKLIDSTLEQLPLTASSQGQRQLAKQEAYTEASLGHSGTPGNSAAPEVLQPRERAIGKVMDDTRGNTPLDPFRPIQTGEPPPAPGAAPPTTTLAAQLQEIGDQASRLATEPKPLLNQTRALVEKIRDGTIDGKFVSNWDTETRNLADRYAASNPDLADRLRKLNETVRDAHMASMSEADAAAYKQARRDYANIKNTEGAVNAPGTAAAGGQVPYTGLRSEVDQSTGGKYALGEGDQNDLARVGQYLRPPADSMTSGRTATTNALTGKAFWGALASGGAGGFALGGLPGAAIGAVGSQVMPWMIQKLYNTPAMQRYFVEGMPRVNAALPQSSAWGPMLAERLMQLREQQQ